RGGPPARPQHRAATLPALLGDLWLQVLSERGTGLAGASGRLRDRVEFRGDLELRRRAARHVVGLRAPRILRQRPAPLHLRRVPVRPESRQMVWAGERQSVFDESLRHSVGFAPFQTSPRFRLRRRSPRSKWTETLGGGFAPFRTSPRSRLRGRSPRSKWN